MLVPTKKQKRHTEWLAPRPNVARWVSIALFLVMMVFGISAIR